MKLKPLMIILSLSCAGCGDSGSNLPGDAGPRTDGTSKLDSIVVQRDGLVGKDGPRSDGTAKPDSGACAPPAAGKKGMRPGEGCLAAACHAAMTGKLAFTLAGTVYTSAASNTVVPSATLRITDKNGQVVTMVTGIDGAFYTTASIAFPVSVWLSKCPDTVAPVRTFEHGDCNACHGAGNRIHLP